MRLLLLALTLFASHGSDLFPTPTNPFAKPGPPAPQGTQAGPTPPLPPQPLSPPTATDDLVLPGGTDLPGGGGLPGGSDLPGGGGLPGGADLADGGLPGGADGALPLPTSSLPPSAPAADEDALPRAIPTAAAGDRPAVHSKGGFKLRPTLCLGALAAACVVTRPREPALIAALDAHHEQWGYLLDPALREAPVEMIECGIGCVSVHSELVWLGLLGQWLPLLPAAPHAISAWAAAVGAPQMLILGLTAFYLLRKLLPRSAVSSLLSVSCEGLLRKRRLHTLATASISPVGLAHWAHALCAIVAVSPGLEEAVGSRGRTVGLFLGAGAASAVSCALTQLLFGRRQQPRSSVSGAVLGLLLLRAAEMPSEPLEIGAYAVKPLRAVLYHVVLDWFSNSLPSPPRPLGIEKLLSMLGAALLIAAVDPAMREGVLGAVQEGVQEGGGWQRVVELARAAL